MISSVRFGETYRLTFRRMEKNEGEKNYVDTREPFALPASDDFSNQRVLNNLRTALSKLLNHPKTYAEIPVARDPSGQWPFGQQSQAFLLTNGPKEPTTREYVRFFAYGPETKKPKNFLAPAKKMMAGFLNGFKTSKTEVPLKAPATPVSSIDIFWQQVLERKLIDPAAPELEVQFTQSTDGQVALLNADHIRAVAYGEKAL